MIEIGIYQHYHGDFYYVEGTSINPDTGVEMVHYIDTHGYRQHRPLSEFQAPIPELVSPRYMKISSVNHPRQPRFA